MVYEVLAQKLQCMVVWPNDKAANYAFQDVSVVGRVPEIKLGDLVQRGECVVLQSVARRYRV